MTLETDLNAIVCLKEMIFLESFQIFEKIGLRKPHDQLLSIKMNHLGCKTCENV